MQRKICPTCNTSFPARLERCPEDGTPLEIKTEQDSRWAAGKLVAGRYVIFAETASNRVESKYRVRTLDVDEVRSLHALRPGLAADNTSAREFRRTAQLLRSLHHPNLPVVESAGDAEDGTPFLVTEIVSGRSLEQLIQAEAPLAPQRVCSIARQIADGLSAAHRRGLLHLWLNPSAILVSGPPGEEKVVIEDFGAAYIEMGRSRNGHRRSGRTLRDLIPANASYCSPEQAFGLQHYGFDARSDLYSLGVIMFQMLTAQLPFPVASSGSEEQAQLASLVAHLEEPVSESLTESSDIPQPLATLVTQLLEKRPQLRPATAQQVIQKLALVEDSIASRALMGLRTEMSVAVNQDSEEDQDGLEAPGAVEVREEVRVIASPVAPPGDVELMPALAASASLLASEPPARADLRQESLDRVLAPASAATSILLQPRPSRSSSGILFKDSPPPRPRDWGRWVMATVVLMAAIAGVFLLLTHRLAPGPGPLSPVKSDDGQSAAEAESSKGSPVAPTKPAENVQPQNSTGTSPTTTPTPSLPANSSTATHTTPSALTPEAEAEIEHAVAAGDIFFEQGKYDLAIDTYSRPLKLDPTNKRLRARIGRARKAKAAEEQYLGEQ